MKKVSVIIVSFNTAQLLRECLLSLKNANTQKDLEIIVVDNASNDSTVEMVKTEFPNVTIIANTENVGFGKANNQGLEKATGEFIFLLNPDATVQNNTIQELVDFSQTHPDVGIVAPQLLNNDGSIQPSCFRLPKVSGAIKEYFFGMKGAYSKYFPNTTKPQPVEAVVAAAMLLPRSVIKKLSVLFDEKFFFYYEDIDLCRRIQKLGLKIFYLQHAKVVHHHGAATSKTGSWAYEQNQKSAKIYFGPTQYFLITQILKYGQKWQKLVQLLFERNNVK